MAPHSSTLAWKIPWTEEPGGLQSTGLWLSDFTFTHWRRKWQPTPRDGRAWWAAIYGVAQSWTQLKQLSSSSSRRRDTERTWENIWRGNSWKLSKHGKGNSQPSPEAQSIPGRINPRRNTQRHTVINWQKLTTEIKYEKQQRKTNK